MNVERNGMPRVVITGMGAVSPLGNVNSLWQGLLAGQSGIHQIETVNVEHVPVKIAGEVRNFDPAAYVDRKDARRMARVSQFAVAAASMAVSDANLSPDQIEANGERAGVVIGTTMGPHLLTESMTTEFKTNGFRRPNPIAFANCLPNMPAHYVSRYFRTFGPIATPSAACATGTQAIGEAVALIRSRRADLILAGGAEAIVQDYIIAGFNSLSALSDVNDPSQASRPFDADRNGFVLSEGAGVLVLESLAHAMQRGAPVHAEVLGYATSSDAYHIAAIDPDGRGAQRAMRWAMEDAGVDSVDYINAHGTSTQANDSIETHAIKRVFGERAYEIPISSNKSMIGHLMAAAGAVEAIASVKTLCDRMIPPTINYQTPDPGCDLDYVPNEPRLVDSLRTVMSNNFGLGGQNASIILGAI